MKLMLGTAVFEYAADGKWTSTTIGRWSDEANWLENTVAAGSGYIANFGTIDPAADVTGQLDLSRTIGKLAFGDDAGRICANWIHLTGGCLVERHLREGPRILRAD
jgi:hypothetical protein